MDILGFEAHEYEVDGVDGSETHPDLEDRLGFIEATDEGAELVLTRSEREGTRGPTEMLRFHRVDKVLRIFPKVTRSGRLEDQFDRLAELQIEAPRWDPEAHSVEDDRYGLMQVRGLPKGFAKFYEYGLGIKRDYRDLVDEIERRTSCTIVRFIITGLEGLDADRKTFRITLKRFDDYRAAVDRSRGRGWTAVRRVIDAECHNAVADLLGLDRVEVKYGTNEVIRAITEEVATGHVMEASDRALIIDEAAIAAPKVAREAPERLSRLRQDIELVSLEVLIDQFEEALDGRRSGDEGHWQRFFYLNQFALQQLFSMPIVVARQQAHVQAEDAEGRGSRITDFLCANAVTRTAVVVEIKTPNTQLMAGAEYRGKGTAGVYPPHRDLGGSVAQVQSQMAAVPQDLAHRLHRTPHLTVDPWNDIRGAVIIGRVSTLSGVRLESFLRYRAGLATVTILGYDEVLERLKTLLAVLTSSPSSDESTATG